MIIVNVILYLSSTWYSILSFNQSFLSKSCSTDLLQKISEIIENMIFFFNFCFTENIIFPSIAESEENMIFTLSLFTKMLFFMHNIVSFVLSMRMFKMVCWYLSVQTVTKIMKKSLTRIQQKYLGAHRDPVTDTLTNFV